MVSTSPQTPFCPFIEEAFLEGCARYGDLGLDFGQFAHHLTRVTNRHLAAGASVADVTAFLNGLHYSDLYLVFACLEGSKIAWACFIASFRKHILDLSSFFAHSRDAAYEIAEDVIADLFLLDGSGHSRIASYDGRSSLARWLRAIVYHRATDEYRRKRNACQPLEGAPDLADETGASRIEVVLKASRYGPAIEDALEEATGNLTTDEKLMLLMRYEQEMQVNEIARVRHVNAAAVSRRLERIRSKINLTFTSILRVRHKLSDAAIEECKAEIVENPAYSILTLLKKS